MNATKTRGGAACLRPEVKEQLEDLSRSFPLTLTGDSMSPKSWSTDISFQEKHEVCFCFVFVIA